MGLIKKEDLYYKDYSWVAISGDNPKITGPIDSSLLNRKEGYEILYFVNKFCEIHKLKQIKSAIKVERIIRDKVPSDIRSQTKIRDWIEANWRNINF